MHPVINRSLIATHTRGGSLTVRTAPMHGERSVVGFPAAAEKHRMGRLLRNLHFVDMHIATRFIIPAQPHGGTRPRQVQGGQMARGTRDTCDAPGLAASGTRKRDGTHARTRDAHKRPRRQRPRSTRHSTLCPTNIFLGLGTQLSQQSAKHVRRNKVPVAAQFGEEIPDTQGETQGPTRAQQESLEDVPELWKATTFHHDFPDRSFQGVRCKRTGCFARHPPPENGLPLAEPNARWTQRCPSKTKQSTGKKTALWPDSCSSRAPPPTNVPAQTMQGPVHGTSETCCGTSRHTIGISTLGVPRVPRVVQRAQCFQRKAGTLVGGLGRSAGGLVGSPGVRGQRPLARRKLPRD